VSIDDRIQVLLNPLASGGAFQDIAIQGAVTPYIVWMMVTSTTNNSLAGASDVQNTRLQIDCYAATQASRKALADSVVTALAAADFQNVQLTSQNLYEQDVKLFRALLEFSVWSAG
jgi:hypothetical protein